MFTAIIRCWYWFCRCWCCCCFCMLFFLSLCFLYTQSLFIYILIGICSGSLHALAFRVKQFLCEPCHVFEQQASTYKKIYYFCFWLIIFSYPVERIYIQENANDKMLLSMSCSSSCVLFSVLLLRWHAILLCLVWHFLELEKENMVFLLPQ